MCPIHSSLLTMNPLTAYATVRLFLDGMLGMMMLYALLSFWQQRRAIYWQYALYIACMIVVFRIDDVAYTAVRYLPGDNPYAANLEAVAFILYIRFASLLIDIPRYAPSVYRVLRLMMLVLAGGILIDLTLLAVHASGELRSDLYVINRLGLAVTALVLCPRIIRLRQPVVTYFIVGSMLFITGCLVALLINFMPALFTRHPANPFSFPITTMQIGVVGEVLCFTLGMALRHQQIEREKIHYQAELINQLRENEQKQLVLQRIRDDIARDLHDDVGAELSAISLLSQVASGQVGQQPDAARQTLATIGKTAREVVTAMRETVWSLRAVETTLSGFCHRIRETAEALFAHQPVQLHLDLLPPESSLAHGELTGDDWIIPAENRRDLLLLVKEMLHNALRHAQATNVTLSLKTYRTSFVLIVADDGRGFILPRTGSAAGNGLRTMQQRADSLNGRLTIDSQPGRGTTLTFTGRLNRLDAAVPSSIAETALITAN